MELKKSIKRSPKTYTYKTSATVALFHTIGKIVYFGCGCNFMFDKLDLSDKVIRIYDKLSKIFEALAIILICSEWGAFFTQKNLTLVHKADLYLYAPTSLTLYSMYLNAVYRRDQIRELGFTLAVRLREMFSDLSIEKQAIRKTWRFVIAMVGMVYGLAVCTGVVTGYDALTTNATFTTVIPVWPSLEDRSLPAAIGRLVHYLVWWVFITRIGAIYFIILLIAITLQHQFAMLHEYFMSLNGIFDEEGSHEEKERRYEDALKVGIKMHSLTLWCTEQTQLTCGLAFSVQVITNVLSLILLMVQWMHMDRSIGNVLHILFFVGTMLISTGIFMWNAGDITFEAARLPTAMFHSGWHNCRGRSSFRVRKMLTIAMRRAQDRVLIKGLGIMELSYESYISITKTSYSVFSVMY